MRRTDGIGLVLSLLVLVVVMALGVGALFLAELNSRVAENNASNSIAQYNGRDGLNASLVVLAQDWNANLVFPADQAAAETLLTAALTDYGTRFQVDTGGYTLFDSDSARIRIVGIGTNNARFTVEALFDGVLTPITGTGDIDPLFGEGFIANDSITGNGGADLYINVWSGDDVQFNGQSVLGEGFLARAAGNRCRIGRPNSGYPCDADQDPPEVPIPDFTSLWGEMAVAVGLVPSLDDGSGNEQTLIQERTSTDAGENSTFTNLDLAAECSAAGTPELLSRTIASVEVTVDETTGALTYGADTTVAVEIVCGGSDGSHTLTGNQDDKIYVLAPSATLSFSGNPADLTNVTVLGSDSTTVNVSGPAQSVTSTGTDADNPLGVQIASRTISFPNSSNVLDLTGQNTFFAIDDIDFKGGITTTDDTARTFFVSEGDITARGDGQKNIYASFWSGGDFTVNGSGSNFFGSAVAVGGITLNGNNDLIRLPGALDNPFVPGDPAPTYEAAGIQVISRR